MRASATAGLAAPIIFTVLVVLQGLISPEYSHVREPISALSIQPNGWIQNVNFTLYGVLVIAFAIGLHLGIAPRSGAGVLGPALLVANGIGLLILAAFPWSKEGDAVVEPPGHVVGAFMTFLGTGFGFILLSWRMGSDPAWRNLSLYTLVSGIAIVIVFFAFGALAELPGMPLHPWEGVVQRVMSAIVLVCNFVLALRLRRVATKGAQGLEAG